MTIVGGAFQSFAVVDGLGRLLEGIWGIGSLVEESVGMRFSSFPSHRRQWTAQRALGWSWCSRSERG